MAVTLESDKTSSLRVTPEGTLVYRMAEEGGGGESGLEIELSASHVNDGRWHHVRVKWMQNETWLSLDFGQLELTRTHLNYRVGALVTKIAVGGKGLDRGCVKVRKTRQCENAPIAFYFKGKNLSESPEMWEFSSRKNVF